MDEGEGLIFCHCFFFPVLLAKDPPGPGFLREAAGLRHFHRGAFPAPRWPREPASRLSTGSQATIAGMR